MTISENVLPSGGWASVELVQATLIALLGCVAWLAARRGGPALRGAILLAALVGLLLAPAVASVAPVWLPLPEWVSPSVAEPPPDSVSEAPPSPAADSAIFALLVAQTPTQDLSDTEDPAKQTVGNQTTAVKAEAVVFNLASASEDAATPTPPGKVSQPSFPISGMLAVLWVVGAAVCLSRALVRVVLLYRCAKQARPILDNEWTDCVESLAKRHDLRTVVLRESREISSPLTLGLFRSVILLPRGWRNWSAEERILILEHEMAHIQRSDFLAGLVAELAVCLCWFHPLVRWLAGRLRLEQEYAADAWVASATADPNDYVRCLARLALELDQRGRHPLAPGFRHRRSEILRRIDMLRRNPKGFPTRLGKRTVWTVAALTAVACMVAGGVGPLHSAADGKKATDAVPEAKGQATADRHGDPLPSGALARLGTTRMRHAAEVTFVAFGPEGKTLLTSSRDNTVRLWELASGKELRRFAPPKPANAKPSKDKDKDEKAKAKAMIQLMAGGGNDGGSLRIALTADGKTLAVGRGNVIQLYNVETGEELRQIQGQADGFLGLLFSPDGKTLAARSGNNTLFLWDAESGKELHQIKPPPRPGNDGFVLIVGGRDANSPGMAFTPNGGTVAVYEWSNTGPRVTVYDVASGKKIFRRAPSEKTTIGLGGLSPDGKQLAVIESEKKEAHLRIFDLKMGRMTELGSFQHNMLGIHFSGDGKRLIVTMQDITQADDVHVLSQPAPHVLTAFALPSGEKLWQRTVWGMNFAVRDDGKMILASASPKNLWGMPGFVPNQDYIASGFRVIRMDAESKELTERFAPCPLESNWLGINNFVLAPDNRTIVLSYFDRHGSYIVSWDLTTGKPFFTPPPDDGLPGAVLQLAFTPDGKELFASSLGGVSGRWNAATGKRIDLIHDHYVGQSWIRTSDGLRTVREEARPGGWFALTIVDPIAHKTLYAVRNPQRNEGFGYSTLTANGKTILAIKPGKNISHVTSWDGESGRKLSQFTLSGFPAFPSSPFSPCGRWVLLNGKLHHTGSGTELFSPAGLPGERPICGNERSHGPVWFSEDGRLMAAHLRKKEAKTAAEDALAVWELASGQTLARFPKAGFVIQVAFARDGRTIALLDAQGVRLEDLLSGKRLATYPAPDVIHGSSYDYLTKPFDFDEVLFSIRRALTQRALIAQVQALSRDDDRRDAGPTGDEELIGRSPVMVQVFKSVGRVAPTREPVLIVGESGTGKELVANALHKNSRRAGQPFIKVNSAALSPTLLESELFGHEKGSFTGAVARRVGRFEQAQGGTLFLDEIGDLGVDLQAKLLRVLQSGQFERVGGDAALQVDVRVLAATNRDLPARIADGRFREDLFYRLNVVTIELPPLRQRREDIPLLAEHILRKLAHKYDWPNLALAPEALAHLNAQPWPGNVRQLQNVLARAAILARGRIIGLEDVRTTTAAGSAEPASGSLLLRDLLAETERRAIQQALEQEKWNRTHTARVLGISRRQLFDKIRQYGLHE